MFNIVNRLRSKNLSVVRHVGERIQEMVKPNTVSLVAGAARDAIRSKTQLIAENALLRHQLIILQRQMKHPQLNNRNRLRLLLLARATPFWRQALLIVQPDTLLRWHCQLFRLVWRRKSKPKTPQTRITPDIIALIRQMRVLPLDAVGNSSWLCRGPHRLRCRLPTVLRDESGRVQQMPRPDCGGLSSFLRGRILKRTNPGDFVS